MRRHHVVILLSIFSVVLFPNRAPAIDSESNREAIVAPRAKKFYKSSSAKQYLSFGGNYVSDYNSRYYQLTSRYLYQSQRFVNEANFKKENDYADGGSGKNKRYDIKTSELYDFSFSSKARFTDSQNYGVFFHRTIYDKLSKFYYDLHTAAGVGRIFFKDKIELDISLGYQDVKAYGNQIDVIPSIRANFKLGRNITFIQRGYWFFDHESVDNELKSSLVYRLSDRMSFELRHTFEKRRYEADDDGEVTNQIGRSLTFGMIFDLQ